MGYLEQYDFSKQKLKCQKAWELGYYGLEELEEIQNFKVPAFSLRKLNI